jgi:drug/metabolite transporter (DMT)-like permease
MQPIHLTGLLILSSIWGASFMFIKVAGEGMTPLAITWVRLGGGGIVMLAVLVALRVRLPTSSRYWRDVMVVAAFGTALPYVLIAWGQQQIPSNLGAVLNGAMPFWVVILATTFLPAERLTRTRLAGVGLGFLGLTVIIGPDALDIGSASTQGQFAIVLAALSYAGGAVYIRRNLLGVSPWALASSQSFAALAMVTPLILAAGEVPDFPALSGRVILAAAALAILAQGVGILIYYWLIANVEATQASFVTYLAPIAAQFWGWAVLGEVPGAVLIPGLSLVIAGMVLLNRRARVPDAPVEGAPAAPPPRASA